MNMISISTTAYNHPPHIIEISDELLPIALPFDGLVMVEQKNKENFWAVKEILPYDFWQFYAGVSDDNFDAKWKIKQLSNDEIIALLEKKIKDWRHSRDFRHIHLGPTTREEQRETQRNSSRCQSNVNLLQEKLDNFLEEIGYVFPEREYMIIPEKK